MEIYVKCNRKDFGPYSLEQLRELVEDGTFLPHDSATVGKSGEWTLIKKIPGFQVEGESTPETVALAELSCPYCRGHVAASELRSCPTCRSPHHEECWRENGGCTVYGCSQAPAEEEPIRISAADWSDGQEESTPATSSTEPEPRPPQAGGEGGIPWRGIGIAVLLVAGGIIWWGSQDKDDSEQARLESDWLEEEDERRRVERETVDRARVEAARRERERAPVVPEPPSNRSEIDRIKAQIERDALERTLRPREIERLYEQANALLEQGKYREVQDKMTLAYAAFKRQRGRDKATGVRYLNLLCLISDRLEENDKSIEYANEMLNLASNDADKALGFNNLAMAYSKKGEHAKAIGYYQKCLAINLRIYGSEQVEVGTTYGNIGTAYYGKGEYDQALEYQEKALSIRLKALGGDHQDVALSYSVIGLCYSSKGEYAKAIAHYEKALSINLTALNGNHPEIGTNYFNLGLAYHSKGDKVKAMTYLLKAKPIFLSRLGPDHPFTKNAQSWIDSLDNQ